MGEAVHVWREGAYEKSLYLLLNFAANLNVLSKRKSVKENKRYTTNAGYHNKFPIFCKYSPFFCSHNPGQWTVLKFSPRKGWDAQRNCFFLSQCLESELMHRRISGGSKWHFGLD